MCSSDLMSFINHTVLPEALEKWPIDMMKNLLPRVYMIIEEINRRFILEMNNQYPDQEARNYGISILKDGQVHMAHLAIIGSHSVNGVAELHTKILKEETFKDFYAVYPDRFHNVIIKAHSPEGCHKLALGICPYGNRNRKKTSEHLPAHHR